MDSLRSVSLPEELCRSAERKFGKRFESIDGLLAAILEQLVREDAANMDERELEIIEQRLRGLGYV
jgi:hypothetical protein